MVGRGGDVRLRSGVSGVVRSQVAGIQRLRILAGMFQTACERGAGSVTVAHVVERSGVSRRTFYELFDDRDDCFLAAFEEALTRASERVFGAYRSGDGWLEQLRAGLVELLVFLDEEPLAGRLLVCESLSAGPVVLGRRAEVIRVLTRAVDAGRALVREGREPLPLAAEATVGGVLSLIYARLCEPQDGGLLELAGPLMSMIVLPYLGVGAARRELDRRLPVRASVMGRGDVVPLGDVFKGSGMRLTYRTVRVLEAVAERPCASNRVVGESAGISDQGQISKLLDRLQRTGLIENSGVGSGKGMPNAWSLTDKGWLIAHGVRTHTNGIEVKGQGSADGI
jgi:AcrR family transcriptional regulator